MTKLFLFTILLPAAVLVAAGNSSAQSIPGSWHKVPLPQRLGHGENTMDFSFKDSLNGICLSDAGYISSTTDGGKVWELDTNFGGNGYSKMNLNNIECTGPHRGFQHGLEETLSIVPMGDSLFTPPAFNEVNWGAYFTLAEKMYDTTYGFRLAELVSIEDLNQSEDSIVIIVTHDGWRSSTEYGSGFLITPRNLSWQVVSSGYIVDSNDVWTAIGGGFGPMQKKIIHSMNGGQTWDSISFSGNRQTNIEDFFVNPSSREVFYLNNLDPIDYAYSSDYGTTWRLDSTFGEHLWRMANPASGILWAMIGQTGSGWTGADVEIFPPSDIHGAPNDYCRKIAYSSDTGHTWTIDSTTFINDSLEEMHFLDARHGWIASLSHDSLFMWYYENDNSSVSSLSKQAAALTVYPNPAESFISVFGAQQPVSILDALGRKCACPESGNSLDVSALPPGVYFVSNSSQHSVFVKE